MFARTNSELLDSIKKTDSIEQNKHHHQDKSQRINDKDLNSDDFMIESIVNKVETLKNDYPMEEMLESETKPCSNQPRLIDSQAKEFLKVFEEQRYEQNRSSRHWQTATKNLKQVKSEKQYDKTENISQSPQQKSQREKSIMKMSRKLRQTQNRKKLLQQQLSYMHIKFREHRKKIEQQYKNLYQSQINDLQIELNIEKQRAEFERSDFQIMIRDYDKKIRNLENTIKKENKQNNQSNSNTEQEITKLKMEVKNYLLERENLLDKIKNLTAKKQEYQNMAHDIVTKRTDQQKNLHLQQQLRKKQQRIIVLSNQNEKYKQDIAHLQSNLKNLKQTIQKLESQVKRITKMKEQSDTYNVRISKQNDKLKKNSQNLQKQMQQKNKKNNYLQKQLQKRNESIENFQKKLQEVIEKLKLLKQQLNDKDKQIKQQKQEKQSLCEQMDRLSTELEDHKVVNKKLYAFKQMVIKQLSAISRWHQLPQPTANLSKEYFEQLGMGLLSIKYFPDSIILRNLNIRKKDFLVNTLCNFLDSHSFDMQLIYRYDTLNPTNFHQYIDKKQNLLIMFELTNGTILAGFSINALDPEKIVRPGRGLLISLTDQKAYKMRQDPKLPVVSYDNYFYILGNAQIRLKAQQKRVFSNFGIANSTFDNGKDQRTDFLKVKEASNNQLEINTYEFYQLRVEQ